MSALDVKRAADSLAWRLREWGITERAETKAQGFIDDLVAQGWQMNPMRESRPQPPKTSEACWTCSKVYRLTIAEDGRTDACCDEPMRRPERGADPTPYVEQIRKVIR